MFFVFGPSGQMYRGGPENLARISAVRSVQRPQALRTRAMDAQDGQPGPVFAAPPRPTAADTNAAAPAAIVNLRMHDAVSAYAQTEQGPQASTRQPRLSSADRTFTAAACPLPARCRFEILTSNHPARRKSSSRVMSLTIWAGSECTSPSYSTATLCSG